MEWRNDTTMPARELWFHLYWNAWKNNKSTWLKESALLALWRGFRFFLSHPVKCSGICLALLLTAGIWLTAYGLIAPGPNQSTTFTVLLTFGMSRVFLLGRLIVKLWFLSGQTLLFQSSGRTPV